MKTVAAPFFRMTLPENLRFDGLMSLGGRASPNFVRNISKILEVSK